MAKNVICWVLAVLITAAAAIYQRMSGPTYPKRVKTELSGNRLSFKLPTSADTSANCEIKIPANGKAITGNVYYKRFRTNDSWDTLKMEMKDGNLLAYLPKQPMAGKLQYFVELKDDRNTSRLDGKDEVVIRFKGDVPLWVLLPHVIVIFLAMLLSNLTGLMAILKLKRLKFYSIFTLIVMIVGGLILGPVMQKFAFGEFWTGVPFGWDLTDNKTFIALVFWIIAVILNLKKPRPAWIIVAALITIVIFSIPHSMFGSELNYTSGTVTTG